MTQQKQNAFTLIELLVVLALLSTLLLLAAPSFRDFYRSSQLSSQTNTFIAALHAAKNEAIKHNSYSYLVPRDGANWSSGWFVFVDNDFDQIYTPGSDIQVLEEEGLVETLTIAGTGTADENPAYISFNGSGYPRAKNNAPTGLTLGLAVKGLSGDEAVKNTRYIVLALTGRIRSCKPSSSNDGNCKSSLTE